jgi:transposase InsO family protein
MARKSPYSPRPDQRLLSAFLQQVEAASPHRQIVTIITGNLSSHDSKDTRAWLERHLSIQPRLHPTGACWLNRQGGWWRIFRKTALAGQAFVGPGEITHTTQVATRPAQRPR